MVPGKGRWTGWQADARDWFRQDRSTPGDYDLVVHAAAIVGGREMIEGAPLKIGVDLAIDSEYFQWLLRARPRHAVYLSSSAAYPINRQTGIPGLTREPLYEDLIDLDNIETPDKVYGISKLVGEVLADYARTAGVNMHVVRPFSGYGDDQSMDYPFPMFINQIKNGTRPFEIWGDGTQVRDWVHIDDVVGCIMAMLESDVTGPLNIGTGRGTSFIQLFEMMHRIAEVPMPQVRLLLDRPQGVSYRVADITKMMKIYLPKITLEEGISRALTET